MKQVVWSVHQIHLSEFYFTLIHILKMNYEKGAQRISNPSC